MGNTGRKNEPPKKPENTGKQPPKRVDDDEDGDIATPKRDRDGNDDEPL